MAECVITGAQWVEIVNSITVLFGVVLVAGITAWVLK